MLSSEAMDKNKKGKDKLTKLSITKTKSDSMKREGKPSKLEKLENRQRSGCCSKE